jgi:hypothetical protein
MRACILCYPVDRLLLRSLLVVVFEINLTTVSILISGLPDQFFEMKPNNVCSTLFHLEVPGGKCVI